MLANVIRKMQQHRFNVTVWTWTERQIDQSAAFVHLRSFLRLRISQHGIGSSRDLELLTRIHIVSVVSAVVAYVALVVSPVPSLQTKPEGESA